MEHDRLTGGLMPRRMGDGGLWSRADHFGVFYPRNFLAVMANRLSMEAAVPLDPAGGCPPRP